MASLDEEYRELLSRLSDDWRPEELRQLGMLMLKLAQTLELKETASRSPSIGGWSTPLQRIERRSLSLAEAARLITRRRQGRQKHLPPNLLGEPAWDMLLDLFHHWANGVRVSVSSLCAAAHAPQSTALRYINTLEDMKLVERQISAADKRVTYIGLTDLGIMSVGSFLDEQY